MRPFIVLSLLVSLTGWSIAPLRAANDGPIGQMLQDNPRFQGRVFHIFAIFDPIVPTALTDEARLNKLFKEFNREFLEDLRKANKSLPFSNFQVIPVDPQDPAQPGIPRAAICVLDRREEITPDALDAALKRFGKSVKPGDIVFCYVNCHGTRSKKDKKEDNVDYLILGGKSIVRKDLLRALLFPDRAGRQRTHLTVFVTDNCRTDVKGPPSEPPKAFGSIWKSLYFAHQGFVDLTSTTDGEPAVTIGESLFLRAFVGAFDKHKFPKESDDRGKELLAANSKDPHVIRLRDGVVPWQGEFERILKLSMDDVVKAENVRLNDAGVDATKLVPDFIKTPAINDLPAK